MTSGISGVKKYGLLFSCFFWVFFVFFNICACILMSTFTQCVLQTLKQGKKRRKKTHSKKSSNSLRWNVPERSETPSIKGLCWSHRVGCHCRDTVRRLQVLWTNAGILVREKPTKICFLSSVSCFGEKESEGIDADLNILARRAFLRHED